MWKKMKKWHKVLIICGIFVYVSIFFGYSDIDQDCLVNIDELFYGTDILVLSFFFEADCQRNSDQGQIVACPRKSLRTCPDYLQIEECPDYCQNKSQPCQSDNSFQDIRHDLPPQIE